ncbi:MAG: carbon-nitrogen family hydrolase [Ardenticatenaceae bacterium]|nr:carbon-nitrogen family hydrolase [Ardenticatenaceae bacterium]MCB8990701.1 carbon-nitrogen family hydrolase [Ardenticatenaceae bacterium]
MKLTIALGQMNVQLGNPQANLQKVAEFAAQAADMGADWLLLPELWSTGYDLQRAKEYATAVTHGIFAETAVLARNHRLAIIGSCLSDLGEGRVGNTAVYHNPAGEIQATYSKTHLFRLMDEDQYLTVGDALTPVETAWGKAGLAICYDLRFPELFRWYALRGARLMLLPAEWPQPRLAHWRTLLQARAIENQLFVAACNRVGEANGQIFFGHSCVVDPWGEVVLEMSEDEGVATAVLDLSMVDNVRAQIPVFADRRPDLYGEIGE